jgi:transcriptional regulator with XRE-family HTH domain
MNDALQYKLARTMLGLTVIETANLCDVSHETIRRIEAGDTTLKGKTIAKVRAAFEKAGVEFIEENGGDPGVRFRKRSKSVEEISKQIDVLEETISSIPAPTAPSPEAAMGTMIKAVAENKVANLKARRKRLRRGASK